MLVKIPQKFKIGATRVCIGFDPTLHSDDGYDGTYNKRTEKLLLDSRLTGVIRDRTLGHELMEVIKVNYELATTEEDMSRIANGWIEFLWQLGIEFDWSDIGGE